jgi:hypothetical protein
LLGGGNWQLGGIRQDGAREVRTLTHDAAKRNGENGRLRQYLGPRAVLRQTLFRLPDGIYLRAQEYYTPFDITPDDRHFIMARRVQAGSTEAASFILVDNWFQEVKAKMRGK